MNEFGVVYGWSMYDDRSIIMSSELVVGVQSGGGPRVIEDGVAPPAQRLLHVLQWSGVV